MRIPETKIDRFIQTDIQALYFRRGEIIYREGDVNTFLYIINSGEANLYQNFEKGEYSFMQNNQYSMEYIKNMAKRIDYKGIMKEAFDKYAHLNINAKHHSDKNHHDNSDDENNINIIDTSNNNTNNNMKTKKKK